MQHGELSAVSAGQTADHCAKEPAHTRSFPCSPKLAADSFRESAPVRRPSVHAPCTCEPGLSPLCRTGLPYCEQSYTQARPPKNPVGNRAPSVELKEIFLFRAPMAV